MQLKPGTLLQGGKYQIIKTLGQGGFGITYEAEQVFLRRKVALKEFFMKDCCERDESSSHVTVGTGNQRILADKFKGKFIREAQMMAGMDHPGIVKVLDVFEENETAYYVMENLAGGSLKEKVDNRGPLPEAEAEKYIRQVADALDYIHSLNTVHLDVKPSNILLNKRGDAILIDFGISKHYDSAGEQTSSTPVGMSKGFAPLEQSRDGDVSQFKPSTDIYALGATLYYLVVGQTPPEASIVYEDGLDRPNGISGQIWHVIEQAMQPRRKDRPQSIPDFISLFAPSLVTRNELQKPVSSPAPPDDITVLNDSSKGYHNDHEWVDLGLPSDLKWASCNVGASSPEESGDYFAWGETEPKEKYNWRTYKHSADVSVFGSVNSLSKYVTLKKWGHQDAKSVLVPEDDVASSKWGSKWRVPTLHDIKELQATCTWTWGTLNGKHGYIVTSKINRNSIFLPASGYQYRMGLEDASFNGYYWSSSLDEQAPDYACYMFFDSKRIGWSEGDRCVGFSIRPVTD